MPKVSVIIPAYNRDGIVWDAIDSGLAQIDTDFEWIIVDEGAVGTR